MFARAHPIADTGKLSLAHATHQITCVGALVGIAVSLTWALPARGAEVPFTEHVISTNADAAFSVFATDLDGDGDTDVLSASFEDDKIAWYENDGGSPPTFTEHVISTNADNAVSVFATDLDGDGDIDVLSASQFDNKIAWYENDGESDPTFTEWVISTAASTPQSVFATDVDGDGDTDVLSASFYDNKIAWYENPTWTEHVISSTAMWAESVFATDVDGDGDTDVLSASWTDRKIAWYESDGLPFPSFTEHEISTTAYGAHSVFATDLDGDGDIDVLSASYLDGRIEWFENDGASDPAFTEREVSPSASGAHVVFAEDVDGDGDIDVLCALQASNEIAWYENDGGTPPAFTERVIATPSGAVSVFATDLDGDGDIDVLSASYLDDKIAWYENTTPTCGNGAVRLGEECDDGNTDDGDGCSATCTVESGYACVGEPSLCGLDCNENSIPDECDLACGPTDDPCDVDGCGQSTDTNGDGMPDDCGACCTAQGCAQTTEALCDGPSKSKYNGDGTVCEEACPSGIPTVSQWGMVAMTLLVLAAGTVVLRRRRLVPG